MTNKEKDILLKDLCGRLTYGVKAHYVYSYYIGYTKTTLDANDGEVYDVNTKSGVAKVNSYPCDIKDVKPYLRPMSSMTQAEADYMLYELIADRDSTKDEIKECAYQAYRNSELMDWLNSNMFDYRGLIGMGLALEAPEDMYKTPISNAETYLDDNSFGPKSKLWVSLDTAKEAVKMARKEAIEAQLNGMYAKQYSN